MSNVRYVNIIKLAIFRVALYKVKSDPFIKVVSDWVLIVGGSLSEVVMAV